MIMKIISHYLTIWLFSHTLLEDGQMEAQFWQLSHTSSFFFYIYWIVQFKVRFQLSVCLKVILIEFLMIDWSWGCQQITVVYKLISSIMFLHYLSFFNFHYVTYNDDLMNLLPIVNIMIMMLLLISIRVTLGFCDSTENKRK